MARSSSTMAERPPESMRAGAVRLLQAAALSRLLRGVRGLVLARLLLPDASAVRV